MPRITSRTALLSSLLATTLAAGVATALPAQALVGPEATAQTAVFTARIDIGDNERTCSGVLVDAQWLLTSATCFSADGKPAAGAPAKTTKATIGRSDLTTTAGQVRTVTQLVPRTDRDVTLARLDKPVTTITPVDIAAQAPAAGTTVTAAGYGRTKSEWSPLKLHTGAFTVGATSTSDLPLTGTGGATLCAGDTGGPQLATNGDSFELVGINSRSWQGGCFGADPAETRTDAIGARVDDLAGWVAKNRLATMHADATTVVTTADFNRDGRPDVAAITADGNLHAFYTTAGGTLIYGRELWKHDGSWARKSRIFGGDFNGDGNADIAAINVDGVLSLYPGTTAGPLAGAIAMWKDDSWGSFPNIATYRAKGWTRDGLVTVAPSGRLYAYPTGTTGALDGTRTEVWHDDTWNKKLITSDDFTSDQLNDIAAIGQDGALGLYTGNTQGKFDYFGQMWPDPSWASFPVMMGGDYNGDGKADIAAINSTGGLYLYPGDGKGKLSARTTMWPAIG
ncbi:trypsin-like serine protease [Streptomyces sp. NPDC016845]|uniref:trypsin-like serine protease n=1 Tax=Streptomyces sp. NPDC016845 TaxID=3364972 RepID=UPI0037BB822E